MEVIETRLKLEEIYNLNIGYIVVTSISIGVAFIILIIDIIKRFCYKEQIKAK